MDQFRNTNGKIERKPLIVILVISAITLSCLCAGIALLCIQVYQEQIMDYTECKDNSPRARRCDVQVAPGEKCTCFVNIFISEPIPGPVTLYYTLPDFDQSRADYMSSKDDAQLAGKLSAPSTTCGSYSYTDTAEGKKPIAPCGEIADSMFSDEFTLLYNNTSAEVPVLYTGLNGITEDDKNTYRNPPGDLIEAFKNFTRPVSWENNVTELDKSNLSNNGFQNERFIAWMKTDLKIKPVLRVNNTELFKDGLPIGTYNIRIFYSYSKYITGPRIAILRSGVTTFNVTNLVWGIILILVSLLLIIAAVICWNKIRDSDDSDTRFGRLRRLLSNES